MTLDIREYRCHVGGKEIIIETGRFAQQAGGAVTVRMGDTMLFCSTTMGSPRPGLDFFPLSVDYEEKMYAGGRVPGGFFRREGRPSEGAILTSRVIDRTLRPLFPKNMRNDVQVILMSLSHDKEHHVDMLGIIAASTALMISDIPWNGPVAGARVGLVDGELLVNPTYSEMVESTLDLRVSGTAEAINMVECNADEVDEATMLEALFLAQDSVQECIALQKRIREELGKDKQTPSVDDISAELQAEVTAKVEAPIREIMVAHSDRAARRQPLRGIRDELLAEYSARQEAGEAEIKFKHVERAYDTVMKQVVRGRIVHEGIRPDGRDHASIRALAAEVGLVPRVHGSGMFLRGETQVLTIATLGTPRDSQFLDGLSPEDDKRYMHHYNFPPYSTGETYPMRGPRRREIGHGALAEKALLAMIPPAEEFPYVLRLVSEVMSSNGSTSMASVCGSTLALLDAGVPIKNPVGGIAMGLIKEGDKLAVLTDIQGMEDHLGDMDFKVAGTAAGITALQMDIKIAGVTRDIMRQALAQAKDARLEILAVIQAAMPQRRAKLSDFAPRMESFKIAVDKIGAVIGPGGKNVRALQDEHQVKVDIQEDGLIYVAGDSGAEVDRAIEKIKAMVQEPELGHIYTGKVTRTENYGAFVEFLPGSEGMVHVSQLADYHVKSVEDEVSVGDEIMVMVINIDGTGRVRLSRQAVLEGWDVAEAQRRDAAGSRGGGRRGGGDRRGPRRDSNRGGDRRGPRRDGNRSGGDRNRR
ncbi:MAG: polyribonucleotide nucleotidyltransferase [Chloroflexi bacterium]|nr:polyribonucleotide nucleotidyltransferase [Chloroflexota bacterium]MCY3583092.1 polyribonucleotide nucleotidyltransferase [Chloroflexota bacterium]MCY3715562.1 polyribonucleotide nucleotidyltransferase [Chloroflexota bacterium]MDE2650700.1 polyribonucleotide nucleotidyltransferase [Chloroflexota bacterium]MXV92587.1 polyribonucleotide nucleotidyltransferase [Chloroflexota bacterium]